MPAKIGDLILIRVLHECLLLQDHACDLGERCTAETVGDRSVRQCVHQMRTGPYEG
jgi:hypothetical protein